jgi:hypothetical protein
MQASQDLSPLTPILGGFVFIAIWILVSFLISRAGWHAFAIRYPARRRPVGKAHASPFTSFGLLRSRYSWAIKVVLSDSGVCFLPSLLFRAFHSPFLVPWASVKRVEKRNGFLRPRYHLDVEDPAGEIHVTLPSKVEHELLRYHKAA